MASTLSSITAAADGLDATSAASSSAFSSSAFSSSAASKSAFSSSAASRSTASRSVASNSATSFGSVTFGAVGEGLEGSLDRSSDDLMMMRDSPCWEDEELQNDEMDEPIPIKAEIRLLVKTTELGKESIEIRSIREFVESEKSQSGFGSISTTEGRSRRGSPLSCGRTTPQGERVYTLQRGTPSPTMA